MPPRGTPLSPVSSRGSSGITTIVQTNLFRVLVYPFHTGIQQINRCPDPSDECLPTGKNCFTNKSNVTLQHDSNDAVEGSAAGAHAEA